MESNASALGVFWSPTLQLWNNFGVQRFSFGIILEFNNFGIILEFNSFGIILEYNASALDKN
ncbi:MAG: hypothetical protein KAI83_04165 [Thiomargarita sp.]|nr:hypothetical protein [Thiomargarita sp.]